MLPDNIEFNDNVLTVTGVWRGEMGINGNQLIHISGIDDFELDRVELITK